MARYNKQCHVQRVLKRMLNHIHIGEDGETFELLPVKITLARTVYHYHFHRRAHNCKVPKVN